MAAEINLPTHLICHLKLIFESADLLLQLFFLVESQIKLVIQNLIGLSKLIVRPLHFGHAFAQEHLGFIDSVFLTLLEFLLS